MPRDNTSTNNFHYRSGMWTTHKPETCDRKESYKPHDYDAKAHEASIKRKKLMKENQETG